MKTLLPVLALLLGQVVAASDDCADANTNGICGPVNAEDLVWLPGSGRLIASGMGSDSQPGQLYLVDPRARTYETLYPADGARHAHDRVTFPDCPGAPDHRNFSAHGLSLQAGGEHRYRLYLVAHGAREAVEVFDIDTSAINTSAPKPAITWIGCVPMPDDAYINSVTAVDAGGLFITRMQDRNHPEGFKPVARGEITGFVYGWRPGEALRKIAGTELAGANGIVASPNGEWVFVAAWGASELVKFRHREGMLERTATLALPFKPDNLRWTREGTILVAGHRFADRRTCADCRDAWDVAEIDPEALTLQIIATGEKMPGFEAATVAVRDDEGLWLGTYRGDRLLFKPLPANNSLSK